jgi:hypothetical protein
MSSKPPFALLLDSSVNNTSLETLFFGRLTQQQQVVWYQLGVRRQIEGRGGRARSFSLAALSCGAAALAGRCMAFYVLYCTGRCMAFNTHLWRISVSLALVRRALFPFVSVAVP